MAGQTDIEPDGVSAFDANFLGDDFERLLFAAERGKAAAVVEPLTIEILDVRRHVRCAPCDKAVASEGNRRRARERRADQIEISRRDVGEVPGRWRLGSEVRVVREEWLSRRAQRAVNDPVVRAERFNLRAAEKQVADAGEPFGERG